MTMVKLNIVISFRVTTEERLMLQNYCEQTGRGQSDVLREFVRSLEKKTSRSPRMTRASLHPLSEARNSDALRPVSQGFSAFPL